MGDLWKLAAATNSRYDPQRCKVGGPFHDYELEKPHPWGRVAIERCVKCGFRKPVEFTFRASWNLG